MCTTNLISDVLLSAIIQRWRREVEWSTGDVDCGVFHCQVSTEHLQSIPVPVVIVGERGGKSRASNYHENSYITEEAIDQKDVPT